MEKAKEFSSIEIQLIWGNLAKMSDAGIAEILERPINEVKEKIRELTGIPSTPYQQKQEEKALKREQASNARQTKKRQLQAKKDWEDKKGKELKKLIAQQNAEREQQRRLRDQPQFATRSVDYSQMTAIRIDAKTIIYAKPGEDIFQVKMRYFDRLKQSKSNMLPKEKSYKEVKKFKPL